MRNQGGHFTFSSIRRSCISSIRRLFEKSHFLPATYLLIVEAGLADEIRVLIRWFLRGTGRFLRFVGSSVLLSLLLEKKLENFGSKLRPRGDVRRFRIGEKRLSIGHCRGCNFIAVVDIFSPI